MKRHETAFRQQRGEHGQVLILALVAVILVIMAILLLFDIQTIIRGKVKAQNGVDAAALTGAEWQKHSLNLIGELNLIRATGTLISDPFLAKGILNDPNSNAAEFFADLPKPPTQEEFTLFPEKEEFYNEDGSVNVEKLIKEVVRVEKEKRYLDALNRLISQLQTRISFVGPLIGFGAAQQAAKNNGITYDDDASDFFVTYMDLVSDSNIYERIAPVFINDYAWRTPYSYMLNSILDYTIPANNYGFESQSYGIAAATKLEFAGMPLLVANPPTLFSSYFEDKSFYEMIYARDWCGLYLILQQDFDRNWWGDFDVDFEHDFAGQSEILPLHITFSESPAPYEEAVEAKALGRYIRNGQKQFTDTFNREEPYQYSVSDNVVRHVESAGRKRTFYTLTNISITLDHPLETYNDEDADRRYDLLPRLSWAVFDDEWMAYEDEKEIWEEYLRGKFKPGLDYKSGALSFFEARQRTATVTGSMGKGRWENTWDQKETTALDQMYAGNRGNQGNGEYYYSNADIGQVFASAHTHGEAQRVSAALNRLNSRSIESIRTNAEAKPLGRIRTSDGTYLRPFEAGGMVLPVFTETALIPIALEQVDGYSMLDVGWIYYLTEFIPLLASSSSIQDAWEQAAKLYPRHLHHYAYYVAALAMLDNPAYRQAGLNWLNAPAVWTRDASGKRTVLYNKLEHECFGLGKASTSVGVPGRPRPNNGGVYTGGGSGGGNDPQQEDPPPEEENENNGGGGGAGGGGGGGNSGTSGRTRRTTAPSVLH